MAGPLFLMSALCPYSVCMNQYGYMPLIIFFMKSIFSAYRRAVSSVIFPSRNSFKMLWSMVIMPSEAEEEMALLNW